MGGQLKAEVGYECFNSDSKGCSVGAPHEIMSAFASLNFSRICFQTVKRNLSLLGALLD